MAATYAEAVTVYTATEIQTQLTTELAANGVVATGFSPVSVERGLIAADARARATEQDIRAEVVRAGFLVDVPNRDPEWIDLYIEGFFSSGLAPEQRAKRLRATKARHLVTLTNQSATGGPYTIQPLQLEASTLNGVKFRNITGGPTSILNAGVGQTLTLEFEAVSAGIAGNVAPGAIYKLTSGAIPGVDVANPVDSLTFAARNDETNAEYTARALARWGALGAGGHPQAARYRILTGVETLTKLGVRDDNPLGPGTVAVYMANASGPASLSELAAAQALFGPYEPLGSRGRWSYLAAVPLSVTVTATVVSDGSNADLLTNITSALASLQAQWPMEPGTLLDTALLAGILRGGAFTEYGLPGFRGVTDVDLVSPASDQTLSASQVLVLIPDITIV